jgi:hypothetical protein
VGFFRWVFLGGFFIANPALICASAIHNSFFFKNLFKKLSPVLSKYLLLWFQDGILKPYVVFFGDNVPKPRVEQVGSFFLFFTIVVLLFHDIFYFKRLLYRSFSFKETVINVLGEKKAGRGGFFVSCWIFPLRFFCIQVRALIV